jgi:hypothetical protein
LGGAVVTLALAIDLITALTVAPKTRDYEIIDHTYDVAIFPTGGAGCGRR